MSWRPDEIWLEAEMLWFRESSSTNTASLALSAPLFFGLAPSALVARIPNGLAESRRRRAELRRRRTVRRMRATTLVVGPAMMLALAAPRLGAAARTGDALDDDPPSSTLRPGRPGLEASRAPGARPTARTGPHPSRSTARNGAPSHAVPFPKTRWHRATSHGLPYAGFLTDGTQLPVEGPDWVTWNPVEDRVPNRPNRLYGNEFTIHAVLSVLTAYRASNPDAPRVVVGDISLRNGGPMDQHRSHQNGLDVDVYYPRLDRRLRAPTTPEQVDTALAQDLLDRFVAAGAQMVFVGYSSKLHGPSTVVIPYPNHENHMHVRFRQPA
jgi:hypothetical protein